MQHGFLTQVNISPEAQQQFMRQNHQWYTVAILEGEAVGYLGLIGASRTELTYCVHPSHQRKGIGKSLLHHAVANVEGIWAKALLTNHASVHALGKVFGQKVQHEGFFVFGQTKEDLKHAVKEIDGMA